ncbi:cupin domain-containing protein [Avibacterium paragallinarum]|uniref:Cupin domain-containing protein n=1 Tax=Avibacterium paragallinarum TaxID=728 RepID=A0A8B3THZ0_AVIPA|nr:cupin domain-containing protein [Avibacterium paragallinarum]RZN60343.1 cupin domain-containing protein [Avibacterium paragallinarum]
MLKLCLPDNISPAQFLTEYWQKKPLLIRNGLPQIVGQFEPEDILELAQGEEVTARLIKQHSDDHWELKVSPLAEQDFAQLPAQWTVLVQNMEQWSPELGQLWNAFGFIPQWQRDDIMVSYAPQGGSVGRHYDEYDVFLVQGYGHRRWQLGKWCDPSTEFKPNQPIRIFDDMGELVLDEVLAPGDVLYVPSRLSHYGVAQDDCLTFSFGLRYPNIADIFENLGKAFNQPNLELDLNEFFIPLRLNPELQKTGLLAQQNIDTIKQQFIHRLAQSPQFDALFKQALATTVSTRRYELLPTEGEYDPDEVRSLLEENCQLSQDNNCKLLYTENPLRLCANGEWLDELNPLEAQILKRLADGECFGLQELNALLEDVQDKDSVMALLLDSLCNWLDDGWILLD